MVSKKVFRTIDEYIVTFPENIQGIMQELRQVIRDVAPEVEETLRYQMPTFRLNGNLVHFAAFKNHIGFFPTPSAIVEFKERLAKYETSKGTVRFPLDEPIPFELVKEIVKFRVKENLKKE